MSLKKAAFLDRDGVINIDHAYVHTPEEFTFIDGVFEACRLLQQAGFLLIIATNQSGIGRGYYTEDDFQKLCQWMKERFEENGGRVDDIFFCPHHPEKALPAYRMECDCRKPKPGMLLSAQKKWRIDMKSSLMVGDKPGDMQAALAAGVGTRIFVGKDGLCCPEPIAECTHTARNLLEAAEIMVGKFK